MPVWDEDYDPEDDPTWDNPDDWPWEEIEALHITRDDSGWDVSVEIAGILIDIYEGIDDETAQDLIWEEIYSLADDNGVDIDKEIDY